MAKGSRKLDDLICATLNWVESELEAGGRLMDDVASDLGFTADEVGKLASIFSRPPGSSEALSNSGLMNCIFPIFLSESDSKPTEQIGTGILVEIGEDLFVLTAAHVLNSNNVDNVLMPSVNGMSGMGGSLRHSIPDQQPGYEDRLDFAYVHLDKCMRKRIHPSITAARLDQLAPAGESVVGDLYTFVGFPWRKSSRKACEITTELITFTGLVTSDEKYNDLGYNRREHIVVRFSRKRAFSTLYNAKKVSPLPQGISGGMALKWPRKPEDRNSSAALTICGITHSFYEREHCLVATNIRCAMQVIVSSRPHLRPFFEERDKELGHDDTL